MTCREGAALEEWLSGFGGSCVSVGVSASAYLTSWCNSVCSRGRGLRCPTDKCRCPEERLSVWIGLTDRAREGEFRWEHSNTALAGYNRWRTSEPNNGASYLRFADENCVHIDRAGFWNDLTCSRHMQPPMEPLYALCEYNNELPGPEELHRDRHYTYYKVSSFVRSCF